MIDLHNYHLCTMLNTHCIPVKPIEKEVCRNSSKFPKVVCCKALILLFLNTEEQINKEMETSYYNWLCGNSVLCVAIVYSSNGSSVLSNIIQSS